VEATLLSSSAPSRRDARRGGSPACRDNVSPEEAAALDLVAGIFARALARLAEAEPNVDAVGGKSVGKTGADDHNLNEST
jgi:hypothetical protein